MTVAIMQPYFFPYLGYFQLINAVDTFVVYDNVEFTKKGWFNRNRLIFNNKIDYFTINIAKDSDFLDVRDRRIAADYFKKEMPKILRKIEQNYKNAPHFEEVYQLCCEIFKFKSDNLFEYIYNSLLKTLEYLQLETRILISSDLPLDHSKKNKYRVFDICRYLGGTDYINPSGGHDLYGKGEFSQMGINLHFLYPELPEYPQFQKKFEPGLSIIDILMHNSIQEIQKMLNNYTLK